MTKEQQWKKYFAYRYAWPIRNLETPSGRKTWAAWFKAKFGSDIGQYHERLPLDRRMGNTMVVPEYLKQETLKGMR